MYDSVLYMLYQIKPCKGYVDIPLGKGRRRGGYYEIKSKPNRNNWRGFAEFKWGEVG